MPATFFDRDQRQDITPEQRQDFDATVQRLSQQLIDQRGADFNPKNKNHTRQVHRQAMRSALVELGLLTITRRSILKRKKRAKIS